MKKVVLRPAMGVLVLLVLPLVAKAEEAAQEKRASSHPEKAAVIERLNIEERILLLKLAREAIEQHLESGTRLQVPHETMPAALWEQKACFVTLTRNGALRGCIGCILPQEPLCQSVVTNAVNAAVRDSRFLPVSSREELAALRIEISVLSVPEKVDAGSTERILSAITPAKDGVILKQGWRQATYLPQVWEHFPDKKTFLRSLCQKGGMPADCWMNPDTECWRYQVEAFAEE